MKIATYKNFLKTPELEKTIQKLENDRPNISCFENWRKVCCKITNRF
jgi:hypothetical protein